MCREKMRMGEAEMDRKRQERKGSEIRKQKGMQGAHLSDAVGHGRLEPLRSLQTLITIGHYGHSIT